MPPAPPRRGLAASTPNPDTSRPSSSRSKRGRSTATDTEDKTPRGNKRARVSTDADDLLDISSSSGPAKSKTKQASTARASGSGGKGLDAKVEEDEIDLVDMEEVPDKILNAGREKRRAKLEKMVDYQCVICLDSTSAATLTSCGHLFCGPCLQDALNTNNPRRTCPMCRQPIAGRNVNSSSKGTFLLNIKTRKRMPKD